MTMRRMGDVATDVLLDEVLGGRVDEMLLDRDANLGALLRLRRYTMNARTLKAKGYADKLREYMD